MGLLVNGTWMDQWYDTSSTKGRFVRQPTAFRRWITADGSSGFPAEAGRYHLYASLACPWAHRTLIARKLKRLESVIKLTVVDPLMGENGWEFSSGPGCSPDPILQAKFLHEVYTAADPDYSGRVTVPVLWDTIRRTIVNNESAEILRMMNREFDGLDAAPIDLYPAPLRSEIDRVNDWVYEQINNGVYRCGFATTQEAYEEAFHALFSGLEVLDQRLSGQRYLMGDTMTEADWRLFTTLIRFDAVYVGHFKCNLRRIADYPNLCPYLRDLYQVPGIAETVDFAHIKRHYYASHHTINPTGIVPLGPEQDFLAPHHREDQFRQQQKGNPT